MNSCYGQSLSRSPKASLSNWRFLFLAVLVGISASTNLARAQEYTFTTLAGAGGPGAVDGPAANARFNYPQGVAVDKNGNIFIADSLNATIRKVLPDGNVTTVAGYAGVVGALNDTGGNARFYGPTSVAVDGAGNQFVADQYNHVIRIITPAGVVRTFAGTLGESGADDGFGSAARFNFPAAVTIDADGNLYVADSVNHTIRKITPDAEVTTLAGSAGVNGSNDGPGSAARFSFPDGVAIGQGSIIYVTDSDNHTIRAISLAGEVTTLAGSAGQSGSADGSGSAARFFTPIGVATDTAGNLYVADTSNNTIRKVTPAGVVTTIAGDPTPPDPARPFVSFADGQGNVARFKNPNGVAVDTAGNIYVADSGNDAIRQITPTGLVTTLAGSRAPGSNDGPGNAARFNHPTGLAVGQSGAVFVVDGNNFTIRQVTAGGVVKTLAGMADVSGSTDGIGSAARFSGPRKLGINSVGELFIADTANSTIRKMTQSTPLGSDVWQVSTFAGSVGNPGGNNGTGPGARFRSLYDVATDRADNLYVADKDNHVIRKVTPAGVVTTFAGQTGEPGSSDGPGNVAQFNFPYGLAVDSAGFVYVADTFNHTIRKITPEGVVSTLAGKAGTPGFGDGIGNQALFNSPFGVAVDGSTNVYVADYFNNLIRKVTPDGQVITLAGFLQADPQGNPLAGSADGSGPNARFYNPKGIAVDSGGTIYVADSFNNAIRIGTTNSCPDLATIDRAIAPFGEKRQLDTAPQTAVAWNWSLIRRPANSQATLSATNVRNPTFTPDVPDIYIFQLQATNAAGASCIRLVSLSATLPPPTIISSTAKLSNAGFSFSAEGPQGTSLRIQISMDLINWLTIGTISNETGSVSIVDPNLDPNFRFYRLRQF